LTYSPGKGAPAKGARREGNSAAERKRILKRLSGTDLVVSAELDPVPISLADLLTLKAGDVIDTQVNRASEVTISIDGQRLFRGLPIIREGRRAFKILLGEGEG
jgi:flagellar motor switch protein FliM